MQTRTWMTAAAFACAFAAAGPTQAEVGRPNGELPPTDYFSSRMSRADVARELADSRAAGLTGTDTDLIDSRGTGFRADMIAADGRAQSPQPRVQPQMAGSPDRPASEDPYAG
ncbi:MAG TPA: DUF4148 domain-containing protein [Noviherbaspirillum sp.]|nr:DUF4148 domain-containing protein [Noviherbaspirillum sp.]